MVNISTGLKPDFRKLLNAGKSKKIKEGETVDSKKPEKDRGGLRPPVFSNSHRTRGRRRPRSFQPPPTALVRQALPFHPPFLISPFRVFRSFSWLKLFALSSMAPH